jgi:hypothetical protein
MKSRLVLLCCLLSILLIAAVAFSQTSASLVGSVKDPTGAIVANAQITVTSTDRGIVRNTTSNGDGEWAVPALSPGKYDLTVVAPGFKKFEAKGVTLEVGQKARVEVAMQVGAATTEVTVEGSAIAQVETQSSELAGTVSGKEISQLQLNGRNFTQLVTLVPGVSNQTGQDEGTVGVAGNVSYSINGGRTEYNNWELDGGDNMDNGSNTTLNVYPSLEAIAEFKVLTSNYGAQYGRNGSGTIEVETKSGTSTFHGSAYEFLRNDAFNANNYFNAGSPVPEYKKHDFGYTIGGPIFIPKVYNTSKQKTFFFWSQEWRRELVPAQVFNVPVPGAAQRTGDFSDLCPNAAATPPNDPYADCPAVPGFLDGTGHTPNLNVIPTFNPNDPNVLGLLSMIPSPNGGSAGAWFYNAAPIQPTKWREELFRIDHNINDKVRASFRYIHDSWDTLNPTPLWTNVGSFPTVQTNFKGPGISLVARLTATISPTLLNEFVASYTADHIILNNVGAVNGPSGAAYKNLFNGNTTTVLPGINLVGGDSYNQGFGEDPGYIPNGPYNSNPTYTYRDNVSKIIGRHNLQFGAYLVTAQKNEFGGELAAGSVPGYLTFDPSHAQTTSGNPFADLLLGNIYSFGQQDHFVKYYNRYKIFEPYFQDDFHVTSRLTLNLGLRASLFGTYRERYHQAFNFDPARYIAGQTTVDPATGIVSGLGTDPTQPVSLTNLPNGIVQCGVTAGVPVGCMKGHLFNPAPRIGFAFDPKGDGKTAIRGGYGVFFEHTNGNEGNTESLENSPPLANTSQQLNIVGYQNIGSAGGQVSPQFPLGVVAIPTKAVWPYMQQWHFDVQHELSHNFVAMVSYVGSKGTHLTRTSDLNQLLPTSAATNPYAQFGEVITAPPNGSSTSPDCGSSFDQYGIPTAGQTAQGVPVPYAVGANGLPTGPAVNLGLAGCGASPDPLRPFPGYAGINHIQDVASSTYHALQTSVRRNVGQLNLTFSYTYSHSIDDSSSRQDSNLVDAYNTAANRASSNFDQRHILNFSYVWDLPFFKEKGWKNWVLGGWQYSGIATFATGSPFSVTFPVDNAGVGNGITGTSAFADKIGDPNGSGSHTLVPGTGGGQNAYQLYNQNAYSTPVGLTFGDAGRNSLRNPNRTNFDMALFKHFAIKEQAAFEFRAEAFNVFNHTEWGYINGDGGSAASNSANLNSGTSGCCGGNFLQVLTAHNPRILQLGAKFIF